MLFRSRQAERREREAFDRNERDRGQLADELVKVQEELPDRRAAAQEAEHAAAGLGPAVALASAAADKVTAANEGITADRQIADVTLEIARADEVTASARSALNATRTRNLSGLAARLAEGLDNGVACPTCGSTEHPRLAVAPTDAASDDDVAEAERAYEDARKVVDELQRRRAALEAKQIGRAHV